MKAVLVLEEMPKNCYDCPLLAEEMQYGRIEFICKGIESKVGSLDEIAEWCPLNPLPKEKEQSDVDELIWDEDMYALGFNRCLHEITGETE